MRNEAAAAAFNARGDEIEGKLRISAKGRGSEEPVILLKMLSVAATPVQ
jgi:hypothetical protein